MVNWTQRFITGLIGAPVIIYAMNSQITLTILINGNSFTLTLVVLYLLHTEYSKLISNILSHHSSESDRWYVETMRSSVVFINYLI